MSFSREEVNDAVQSLVGIIGMKRRQAKVAGFGKSQSMLHGFLGSDLTNQDYIRCLAQGVF